MASPGTGPLSPGRRIIRPFFFFLLFGLLAVLLTINGMYEAGRAQESLSRLLFDQGAALVEGLEKTAQGLTARLAEGEGWTDFPFRSAAPPPPSFLEEAVADLMLERALEIDGQMEAGAPGPAELEKIARREHLGAVEVVNASAFHSGPESPAAPEAGFYRPLLEGRVSYAIERRENEDGQIERLSLAVVRRTGGVLILRVAEKELGHFRRRVILQGIVEEWRDKGEVQYLIFQGEDGEVWAHSDPARVGSREESPFLREVRNAAGRIQSRRRPGVLEVAKAAALNPGQGLIRVGLSTVKMEQIVAADRRNLLLLSLLLLISGGAGLAFLRRLESRHLLRIGQMEEKVRQSERLSALANLAAGVAHEIRNPLNAIAMAVQRLQREFSPAGPERREEYRRFTDLLRGEVRRVNEIIEQFLSLARPQELDRQTFPPQELLQDLLLLARGPATEQKIQLELEADADLPALRADRKRLQQALWNLILNGLQAMPHGGKLRLSARRRDGGVLIQIADTGEGIPAERLGRIFDYYFTTKEQGVGLGMPIAHKIIQEHGGSLRVESAPGRGTTFGVLLPLGEDR